MKAPRLRQLASTEFDNENSPPNRMVVAVHGLLIVNRDQTELNYIMSKTTSLFEADATWGRLPYLVKYAHCSQQSLRYERPVRSALSSNVLLLLYDWRMTS